MQVGENSECHYFAQHIKELQDDYKMDRGNQLAIYCPRIGKSLWWLQDGPGKPAGHLLS